MTSPDPRKGSLDVPTLQFPADSRNHSIISLDGFRSPSPLPSSPGISGDTEVLYELAESVQIDGTKAAIAGNFQRVKEIVRNLRRNSYEYLIDLATEEDGYNMLHFAVCYKRTQIVKFLIENGANVQCATKDDENDTPLMLTIRYYDSFTSRHLEAASTLERGETSASIVNLLLEHADFNAHNASGMTPLSLAVQKQNESITRILLDKPGIIINKPNLQGYSPLHFACSGENASIVDMLLEKGADMFAKTDKGYIPLHIACRRGRAEILELLIQKCQSGDKKKLFEARDNFGNNALLLAKEAPSSTAFNVLQTKHKFDIYCKNNNGDGLLHRFAKDDDGMLNAELLKKEECVRMLKDSNWKRETPLHIACQLGHWRSIVLFIEKGASISVKNASGNTPLMAAIMTGKKEALLHMLKAINEFQTMSFRDILSVDAKNNKTILTWAIEGNHTVLIETVVQLDLHLVTESDPNNGKALVHIAAASGSLSVIKVLLNSKHVIELLQLTDSNGKTPLMLAAQYGHIDCVKALHVPGAKGDSVDGNDQEIDLNVVDNEGRTALHLACLNGHFPVVNYLCTCGTDLEACEGEDGTPLACAASKGYVKILNYLLGHDVDINGGIKVTPLLSASKNGHEKCVKQLLQQPHIDVSIKDEDGHNCLALAALNRHLQVALAIVNSPHWQKALKGCDRHSATPLRLLIKYLPDAAEVVLFRCINQIKNDKGEVTAIEMSFEFLDDFQDPVEGGIYGFINGVFSNGRQAATLGAQTVDTALWKNVETPVKFNQNNHVLRWMVKYERTSLLQHPVTRELVSYKWKAYAMPVFLINLAIYLVFLAFLTAFAVVLPLPTDTECDNRNRNDCIDDPTSEQIFLRFAATLLLVYSGVRSIIELVQLIQRRLDYLTEPENYLEILLIVSTIIVAIAAQAQDCLCLSGFSWQFGALAVFLGWIDLVLYLRKLPHTGIPINMLQNVVVTFLKLIYLPMILIIAFAIPLYMLFSRPQLQNSFDTPAFSLMKSFVMTTGEIDYETIFRFRDFEDEADEDRSEIGDINYVAMSYLLSVVFIILMPILFANLLVGLAVGDTQKVEEKATLTYLSLQVSLALEVEGKSPWIRRRLKKTLYSVQKFPNVPSYFIWYHKLIHRLFGNSFKELEKNVQDLQSEDRLLSLLEGFEVLEPIDDVRAQVQINTNIMVQLKNTLDILMKESAEAAQRDENTQKAIKDLKEDVKKRGASGSSRGIHHRPNVSKMVKEFVVQFEGSLTDQSDA